MSDRRIAGEAIRLMLCFLCFYVVVALLLVPEQMDWIRRFGLTATLLLLLVPQFLLPILLPRVMGLTIGSLLYAAGWALIWLELHHEVELAEVAGVEHRSYLSGALFMLSNISFVLGLFVRAIAQVIVRRYSRPSGEACAA